MIKMKKTNCLALIILLLAFVIPVIGVLAQVPAFPGAEGFGSTTVGGRGGTVIKVTNTNDSGTGSLRAAVEASGARYVVFTVGGTISLQSALYITNPYLTIAGQTAPGGGICLKDGSDGQTLRIETHDVIVRCLRIRPGPSGPRDGVWINGGYNIIFDHCSVSWGVDENFTASYDAHDITIQWCIISQALRDAGHSKGWHSMGLMFGSYVGDPTGEISAHHNLLAHNLRRNPMIDIEGTLDYVNNVIYNWGDSDWSGYITNSYNGSTNFVGNFAKPGPASNSGKYLVDAVGDKYMTTVYVSDNITHHRTSENDPETDCIDPGDINDINISGTRISAPQVTTWSAPNARDSVLANAGAIVPARDAIDQLVIQSFSDGTNKVIDDPSEVGGWPTLAAGTAPTDTDGDGMPDDWETSNGLNPNSYNPNGNDLDSNYKNIEVYINSLISESYGSGGPATTFTLTTNTSGSGDISLNPSGGTYDSSTVVTVSANAASGYKFDNWGGDLSGSANPETITMNSNKSVTAYFSQADFTVYDGCDANIVTGTCDTENTGYTGSGYANTDNSQGTYVEWTNVSVTETNAYNVNVRFANGGTSARSVDVSVNGSVQASLSFESTGAWTTWSTKSFSINLNSGTNTVRLIGTGSESCPNIDKLEVPTGSQTTQYTLSTNVTGNGSITLDPAGGTYDSGTIVTLTANPDANNQFDNWSGDLTGSTNPETITMDGNKSVTANFSVIQYTLTTNVSGNGGITLDPAGGTYDAGTIVTITANPDASNQFDNWSGDLTGSANPDSITMNGNKSVTANFSVIQYTLTTNVSGNGSITLDPAGGTYDAGTVVTLTANPDQDNQFDNWSGDLSGSANPDSITMDGNKSVTANFSSTSGAYQQDSGSDGIVSIEVENYDGNTAQGSHSWDLQSSPPTGASGGQTMQSLPNSGTNITTNIETSCPRLDYNIDFVKTGTHYVWIRAYSDASSDNSIHYGVNGSVVSTADNADYPHSQSGYVWARRTMDGPDAT
ncbi:carbohydrate-binding protein, partial [candidate division KSB1 bacterium]|nr:carbohydrate-binding protein [candidate division KSB1 bacterium]